MNKIISESGMYGEEVEIHLNATSSEYLKKILKYAENDYMAEEIHLALFEGMPKRKIRHLRKRILRDSIKFKQYIWLLIKRKEAAKR